MASEQQLIESDKVEQPSRWNATLAAFRAAGHMLTWVRQNRLIGTLLAVTVLLGLFVTALSFWSQIRPTELGEGQTLQDALQLLDERSLAKARDLAKQLARSPLLRNDQIGGPAFVLGAAAVYEAELFSDSNYLSRLYIPAARYLTLSREHGFPAGRENEGLFLLGQSLYYSRQRATGLVVLKEALERKGAHGKEIQKFLVLAYVYDSEPKAEEALYYSREYLANADLTQEERDDGLLLLSKILFAMDRNEQCRQELQKISDTTQLKRETLVLDGQLHMRRGDQVLAAGADDAASAAAQYYEQTIQTLRQVQIGKPIPDRATRHSSYLIGVAYRKSKDYRAAHDQFTRTARSFFETDEGVAASLEVAEMLQQLDQRQEALEAYRQALRNAGDGATYQNEWITLEEFQSRCYHAYEVFLEAEQYDLATDLAHSFSPTFPIARALLLQGKAQQAWARHLKEKIAQLPPVEVIPVRKQAYKIQRDIGLTFDRLARLRAPTREYPGDIRQSAQAYLAGHDYKNAVRQFRIFLKTEPTEGRAAAFVGLGEALLSLNQLDDAIQQFQECIEFHPYDPTVYRARLLCSGAMAQKTETEKAKELLIHNLFHGELKPNSVDWRDSLFKLGEIFYHEGRLTMARTKLRAYDRADPNAMKVRIKSLEADGAALKQCIDWLREAVQRYPTAPQTTQTRYLLADAHRLSATLLREKMEYATIQTTRNALNKQMQSELAEALAIYSSLIDVLTEQQGQRDLIDLEQVIQRNCYFIHGYVLFDLGRYEEAIESYRNATTRYQHHPESLEAFVQIAGCYRHLERPVEARGTVGQAQDVLDRMDRNASFLQTTRFSREEWIEYLDWLATL